jgi:hypothetical protein
MLTATWSGTTAVSPTEGVRWGDKWGGGRGLWAWG